MQATHPSISELNVRTEVVSATPHAVEDHELIDDYAMAPVLEVSEEEFDELAEDDANGTDLSARVAAALAASTRAEANLRALFRTVKFLGASVGAARQTNAHLLKELTRLHSVLGDESAFGDESRLGDDAGSDSSHHSSQTRKAERATLLEQALQDATEQAVREREFLIQEHDAFIASLISDHEKEIERLRERLAETERELAESERQERPGQDSDAEDSDADDSDELSRGWGLDD